MSADYDDADVLMRMQCPAKGVTVPYRPKLALAAPVLVAAPGGQTFAVQGQYIIPQSVTPVSRLRFTLTITTQTEQCLAINEKT